MDNPLLKYLNQNLTKAINNLTVKQGTTKDGNPYCYIALTLANGFTHRIFPSNEGTFAFTNAFDMLDINKQIDAEF